MHLCTYIACFSGYSFWSIKIPVHSEIFFNWRMVRDSNPRTGCPVNGFQDRRIRPLCQPSLTFFFRRSFNLRFCSLIAPDGAAHHSFALGCALLALLTRTQDRRYFPVLPNVTELRLQSYSIFSQNANKIVFIPARQRFQTKNLFHYAIFHHQKMHFAPRMSYHVHHLQNVEYTVAPQSS